MVDSLKLLPLRALGGSPVVLQPAHPTRRCYVASSISKVSPHSVSVSRMVPAGSSITECAARHAEIRHGRTLPLIFLMRSLRSRYTRSIGNCMKNVWTASQGTIHIPSPWASPLRPSSPFERFTPLPASSALSASSVFLVRLRTRMRPCCTELRRLANVSSTDFDGREGFILVMSVSSNRDLVLSHFRAQNCRLKSNPLQIRLVLALKKGAPASDARWGSSR
jgi:hypothetical protein